MKISLDEFMHARDPVDRAVLLGYFHRQARLPGGDHRGRARTVDEWVTLTARERARKTP